MSNNEHNTLTYSPLYYFKGITNDPLDKLHPIHTDAPDYVIGMNRYGQKWALNFITAFNHTDSRCTCSHQETGDMVDIHAGIKMSLKFVGAK